MITIDVAVLLGIIALVLLRRPVAPRKRVDTFLVMLVAFVLGILVAPTPFGEGVANVMNQLSTSISSWGN
ncbi:hypothetical protein ABII15_37730 [Streptomyces sp. HUAS MG91]|uniref:Uncharacterized protein n=1 Tax=Streptomyces tabacisoli TaxID=3156398 RepID=A0AAU8J4J1_9ACTN